MLANGVIVSANVWSARVGEHIRIARLRSGMTQTALAARVGLSRVTLSNYECGRRLPDLYTAVLLCEVLRISLDALVSGRGLVEVCVPAGVKVAAD